MILPLVVFPDWARELLIHLPWASFVQTPADIWLDKKGGIAGTLAAIGWQAAWGVAPLALAAVVLRHASRKVVIQGG